MNYFNSKNEDSNIFSLEVDDQLKGTLLEMTRWTKFLSIVGFVIMGIFALLGLVSLFALKNTNTFTSPGLAALGGVGLMFVYILGGSFYIYPTYSLFKYSTGVKQALQTNNKQLFNESFNHLKNMFKYMGILILCLLCIYGIAIIAVIIGAAMHS